MKKMLCLLCSQGIGDKTTECHILLLVVSKHTFDQIKRTALLEFIPLFEVEHKINYYYLVADPLRAITAVRQPIDITRLLVFSF